MDHLVQTHLKGTWLTIVLNLTAQVIKHLLTMHAMYYFRNEVSSNCA